MAEPVKQGLGERQGRQELSMAEAELGGLEEQFGELLLFDPDGACPARAGQEAVADGRGNGFQDRLEAPSSAPAISPRSLLPELATGAGLGFPAFEGLEDPLVEVPLIIVSD